MKILCIAPGYKPAYVYGGPTRSIAALNEALVHSGNDITVFTTNANGPVDLKESTGVEMKVDGVKVIYFNRWTKDHSNFTPALLLRLNAVAADFDIIHIHSWWNAVAIPAAFICWMKGIKPIISPRGSVTSYTFSYRNILFKRILHALVGKALLKYSSLHATSIEEDGELRSKLDLRSAVYILPNILNLPVRLLTPYRSSEEFKLIFLSRIDPKKNLELIFSVLKSLPQIPFSLVIIGDGEEGYVTQLKAISKGLPNIIWKGNLDGDEKFSLLAEADLFLLPSYSENYGNVIFEALSQGTPVLISNRVGAKDYVEQNHLGWVLDVHEQDWKQMLIEIWMNKEQRYDIRRRAPICITRDFNTDEQVKAYIKMYKDHIGQLSSE